MAVDLDVDWFVKPAVAVDLDADWFVRPAMVVDLDVDWFVRLVRWRSIWMLIGPQSHGGKRDGKELLFLLYSRRAAEPMSVNMYVVIEEGCCMALIPSWLGIRRDGWVGGRGRRIAGKEAISRQKAEDAMLAEVVVHKNLLPQRRYRPQDLNVSDLCGVFKCNAASTAALARGGGTVSGSFSVCKLIYA